LYLLILESIGTSELILIGIIALIVFGPRKLPQIGKSIGKTMADFRRTTNEFKATWEKEAEFYKDEKVINPNYATTNVGSVEIENTISNTTIKEHAVIEAPVIKEVEQHKIDEIVSQLNKQNTAEIQSEKEKSRNQQSDKRNWL
jgi:TatA/E family protein of Tat protein translocase